MNISWATRLNTFTLDYIDQIQKVKQKQRYSCSWFFVSNDAYNDTQTNTAAGLCYRIFFRSLNCPRTCIYDWMIGEVWIALENVYMSWFSCMQKFVLVWVCVCMCACVCVRGGVKIISVKKKKKHSPGIYLFHFPNQQQGRRRLHTYSCWCRDAQRQYIHKLRLPRSL